MALDSTHPQYSEFLTAWTKIGDCYAGEDAIKAKGVTYLPATPGQNLDGMQVGQTGYNNYQAYKTRANFPDYVKAAVQAMVGVMHHKPAVIELPPALEPLKEVATVTGESLDLLLRRINEQQLLSGRIGLLLDLPSEANASLPYIATYDAERVINWDDGAVDNPTLQSLNLVVLNESGSERTGFTWREVAQYRVLVLGDLDANEPSAIYRQGLFRESTEFSADNLIEPSIRGKKLEQIPFVFINSTDLLSSPLAPPLLELANLCLTIYKGEADYRQNLFMQAQDTLVVIGAPEGSIHRVGAGASIHPPLEGDAKYIGVSAAGIGEQRSALENDRRRAGEIGAQMLNTTSRAQESGEALKIRVAAQTASLNQIALTGALGLQSLLRIAAVWVGADPNAVKVTPNLDFADAGMSASEFLQLTQAKKAGFPLADESLHALAVEHELTALDFKAEMALLEAEKKAALEMMRQTMPIQQQNPPPFQKAA